MYKCQKKGQKWSKMIDQYVQFVRSWANFTNEYLLHVRSLIITIP